MRVILKKSTTLNKSNFGALVAIFLFLMFNAKILPFYMTNALVTTILALIGMMGYCLFVRNFDKTTIICFVIAIAAALYSINIEGLRYFLVLLCIISYQEFYIKSYMQIIKCLIICGGIYSIVQIGRGDIRAVGFDISGPQFACTMLICLSFMTVHFFNNVKEKKIYFTYPSH